MVELEQLQAARTNSAAYHLGEGNIYLCSNILEVRLPQIYLLERSMHPLKRSGTVILRDSLVYDVVYSVLVRVVLDEVPVLAVLVHACQDLRGIVSRVHIMRTLHKP